VAQPVSAVAHRNLLRRQDDADWVSGVLGISMAGAYESMAFYEVDWRDGSPRPSQTEELSFKASKSWVHVTEFTSGYRLNLETVKPCNFETLFLSALAGSRSLTQGNRDVRPFAGAG